MISICIYILLCVLILNLPWISAIIEAETNQEFLTHVLERIQPLLTYPPGAIQQTKCLVFSNEERQRLHAVNAEELDLLVQRFMDPECHEAIAQFLGLPYIFYILIHVEEKQHSKSKPKL